MNLTCPKCKTANQENARFCSSCGVAFAVAPIQAKPNINLNAIAAIFAVILAAVFCLKTGSTTQTDTPVADNQTQTAAPTISQTRLKLLSSSGNRTSDSYLTVQGEVQNISSESIDTLWAVVTLYDNNEQFISSENSIVEYTPLVANQTTPFKVILRRNPLMKTYRIGFKTTFGGEMDYMDARQLKNSPKIKKSK